MRQRRRLNSESVFCIGIAGGVASPPSSREDGLLSRQTHVGSIGRGAVVAHVQSRGAKRVVEVAAEAVVAREALALEGVGEVRGGGHDAGERRGHVVASRVGLAGADGRVRRSSSVGLEKQVIGVGGI